ncbi:MAG: ATP-binding protein [Myxococcota bacterium]
MTAPSAGDLRARLEFHQRMEALVLQVARRFLELAPSDPIDAAIEKTLAEVAKLADVDFAYLIQLEPGAETFSMTHRWSAPDVNLPPPLRHTRVQPYRAWIDALQTGEPQRIPNVAESWLPPIMRDPLLGFGMHSLLTAPMFEGHALVGWTGMASRRVRRWDEPEVTLVRFVSDAFTHALRRHRDEAALRRSEARFKAFLDQNPDAMYVLELDPPLPTDLPVDEQVEAILDSPIMLCNAAGARQFRGSVDEILGRRFREAFVAAMAPEALDELRKEARQFVLDGYRLRVDETLRPTADGAEEWVSRSAHGVVERGRLTTIWATSRDVTAQKKARDEHERMVRRLQQSERLESIGLLAGGVAHDFNNLLLAILGNADIAALHLSEPDRVHESLLEIRRAGQRAADLTRQLLAFSRKQPTVKKPVSLNDLLASTSRMLERVLPEHIEVDFIPGHDLGVVLADEAQIEQLLLNLCINARDAMPEGGRLTIETQNVRINGEYCRTHPWARPGRYVLLTVADTGSGIPEADLEHVFEPFFTTKGPGHGTGLGLATVYGITKKHGGMIHVYSEEGVGTTFKIYLPITEQEAVRVGSEVRPAPPRGHETILLAEDEEQVRTVAARILERAGYTVVAVANGQEAVEAFEADPERFDVVVLDVVMPVMDGRVARARIQQTRPEVPVLFSSGYAGTVLDGVDLEGLGAPVLHKPYDPDELLAAVRRALDTR